MLPQNQDRHLWRPWRPTMSFWFSTADTLLPRCPEISDNVEDMCFQWFSCQHDCGSTDRQMQYEHVRTRCFCVCVCSCYLFWNHLWFLFGLRIEYKHFTSELVAGHVIKKGSYVISRKTKMTLETLEFGSKPFQIVLGSGFIERPLSTLSLSLSSSSTTVSEAPSIIAFALWVVKAGTISKPNMINP